METIFLILLVLTIVSIEAQHQFDGYGQFGVNDGYVCQPADRVFTTDAISNIHCAAICHRNQNCKSFFYGSTSGKCYGCRHVSNGRGLATETDTTYYIQIDNSAAISADSSNETYRGTILVWNAGEWGTICDDNWLTTDGSYTVNNGIIACQTFGLVTESVHQTTNSPRSLVRDTGVPIWMDFVQCTGTEVHILDCPFDGFGIHNCAHSEDVEIWCVYS